MADKKQPLITIRKPDGTFVKVTLEEFEKMKAGKGAAASAVSATANDDKIIEKEEKNESVADSVEKDGFKEELGDKPEVDGKAKPEISVAKIVEETAAQTEGGRGPMIRVKKEDGSFAEISLEEYEKNHFKFPKVELTKAEDLSGGTLKIYEEKKPVVPPPRPYRPPEKPKVSMVISEKKPAPPKPVAKPMPVDESKENNAEIEEVSEENNLEENENRRQRIELVVDKDESETKPVVTETVKVQEKQEVKPEVKPELKPEAKAETKPVVVPKVEKTEPKKETPKEVKKVDAVKKEVKLLSDDHLRDQKIVKPDLKNEIPPRVEKLAEVIAPQAVAESKPEKAIDNLPVATPTEMEKKPEANPVKKEESKTENTKKEEAVKPAEAAKETEIPKTAFKQVLPKPDLKPDLVVHIDKEDLRSLLDEPVISGGILPLTSSGRENQVDEIIRSLSFKISSGNNNRLRTIILLFLKDIRTEEETMELLQRKEIEGGVGLSQKQAEEVIFRTEKKYAASDDVPIVPLKGPTPKVEEVAKKPEPVKQTEPVKPEVRPEPVRPVPELKVVEQRKPAAMPQTEPKLERPNISSKSVLDAEVTRNTLSEAVDSSLLFKIKERPKTSMQDVTKPLELGPVDEIREMNLTDYRRLSDNPVESTARLKQKFQLIREMSIIQYFLSLSAWKNSPLYRDYISLIGESLATRKPLSSFPRSEKISSAEVIEIAKMERDLM